MASDVEPDTKAIRNERVKLTAGFVDRMAGACFAAGVVPPRRRCRVRADGSGHEPVDVDDRLGRHFLLISLVLHLMARHLLKGLVK